MRVGFLLLVGLIAGSATLAYGQGPVRYRLAFPESRAKGEMSQDDVRTWRGWLIERGYDIAGFHRPSGVVDVILRDGDSLDALKSAGFVVLETELSQPLAERNVMGPPADPATSLRSVPPGYVNPTTLESFLFTVAADHPSLTNLTVIGQTVEGRDIYSLEISNTPGISQDKPSILLNGLHHSREVVTPHVIMDVIDYLTDQYAAGNLQVISWVDNYKIYCVPMVNPDGSNQVHEVDDFHRKNMRPVCVATNPGVDLNRNYPYSWGSGIAACERGSGSSSTACSNAYRGTTPASEPESMAMMALAQQQRFMIAVSYHSYGEFIDYPYACNDGNPDNRMPEHAVIDAMMRGMQQGIVGVGGPAYDVYSPIAIGPVNGDDTSWYYAHHGTYAMIVEVGTSFLPDFSTGSTFVAQNRGGWFHLFQRLGQARIDVEVRDHVTALPLSARVEILDFTFDTGELPRMSDSQFGRSRWLVPPNATYSVRVSQPGYQTRTLLVAMANNPVNVLALLVPNAVVLGDSEPDGDIDMLDFLAIQVCHDALPLWPACRRVDLDGDGLVTLFDYGLWEPNLVGP